MDTPGIKGGKEPTRDQWQQMTIPPVKNALNTIMKKRNMTKDRACEEFVKEVVTKYSVYNLKTFEDWLKKWHMDNTPVGNDLTQAYRRVNNVP